MFKFAGFIENAPCLEKIKAFEKYFTSRINLYDKVSLCVLVRLIRERSKFFFTCKKSTTSSHHNSTVDTFYVFAG